jgi:hypothetical protein
MTSDRKTITVTVDPVLWERACTRFYELHGYRKGFQGTMVDEMIVIYISPL